MLSNASGIGGYIIESLTEYIVVYGAVLHWSSSCTQKSCARQNGLSR